MDSPKKLEQPSILPLFCNIKEPKGFVAGRHGRLDWQYKAGSDNRFRQDNRQLCIEVLLMLLLMLLLFRTGIASKAVYKYRVFGTRKKISKNYMFGDPTQLRPRCPTRQGQTRGPPRRGAL